VAGPRTSSFYVIKKTKKVEDLKLLTTGEFAMIEMEYKKREGGEGGDRISSNL